MDREAWSAEVHRVAESRTRLSDWTELKAFYSESYPNQSISHLNWLESSGNSS